MPTKHGGLTGIDMSSDDITSTREANWSRYALVSELRARIAELEAELTKVRVRNALLDFSGPMHADLQMLVDKNLIAIQQES